MINSDPSQETYEVFAIRYAGVQRRRIDNFIGMDVHDGPMAMDFYVWLLRSSQRTRENSASWNVDLFLHL